MSCKDCNHVNLDDVKNEVGDAVKSSRLMSDMVQSYDRQNKRLWAAILALAISIVIMAVCSIWAVTNAQSLMNEAMYDALEAVSEIEVVEETTTTTTEVVQDTGDGAGNNVYLDGDSTTYNEGGVE